MLKSKHYFIQQGALTPNDNGVKKFNSSAMRYSDEVLLEWMSDLNSMLGEVRGIGEYTLISDIDEEAVLKYSQIDRYDFKDHIRLSGKEEIYAYINNNPDRKIAAACEAGDKDEKEKAVFLYKRPLCEILRAEDTLIREDAREDLREQTLEKLKSINDCLHDIGKDKKTVIYGSGDLAEVFFRYADISVLNIIRVVDKNKTPLFDTDVFGSDRDNLADADAIVVTPHFASKSIRAYLESLNLDASIYYLSDLCNATYMSALENRWTPDGKSREYPFDGSDLERLFDVTEQVNEHSIYS